MIAVSRTLAAATLASLPDMTPARLRALWSRWPDPRDALAAAQRGEAVGIISGPEREVICARWQAADPGAVAVHLARRAARVFVAGDPDYPIADDIPERPRVLFAEGGSADELIGAPRVAVVGTRAATPNGLADAHEIGTYLARSGIVVVSGMAIGIDGAAHRGALDAGGLTVGVLATGLDIAYPRRHASLHERVREHGLLVSENAYGTPPMASRFPVRNRIIAALADAVVVIEATARGGARITAEHGAEYGRPVLAVPGSRRNPSAAGCNELIRDGATPLLEPDDIVLALGFTGAATRGSWSVPRTAPVDATAATVLRALGGEPATTDQLATRTALALDDVALAVDRLARAGRVTRERGVVWPV